MKEASDAVSYWGSQVECFFLFSYMREDLIRGIRGSHQQALPPRVFLSPQPGREIREPASVH